MARKFGVCNSVLWHKLLFTVLSVDALSWEGLLTEVLFQACVQEKAVVSFDFP